MMKAFLAFAVAFAIAAAGTAKEACEGVARFVNNPSLGIDELVGVFDELSETAAQGYIRSAGKCLDPNVPNGLNRVQDSLAAMKATPVSSPGANAVATKVAEKFDEVIPSMDAFHAMRHLDPDQLTAGQIASMKTIRENIPDPVNGEIMQKVIPQNQMLEYLNGTRSQITGSVCKHADVADINTLSGVKESLRLDYPTSPFPTANEVYVLEFSKPSNMPVSKNYGPKFGGSNTDGYPFTGNGFTGTVQGRAIPEYVAAGGSIPENTVMYSLTSSGKTPFKIYTNGNWINP